MRRDNTIRFYNITNVHFIILIVMVIREIIYVANDLKALLSLQIDPKVAFPRRAHPKVSNLNVFFKNILKTSFTVD